MRTIVVLIFALESLVSFAQTRDSMFLYRRGSICSFMIGHRDLSYADEIEQTFNKMPVPDKYNDHGLGKKVFYTADGKLKMKDLDSHMGFRINGSSEKSKMNAFDSFLMKQQVASRLVAKWFNRKKSTGICNMSLVQERGYENASELDKRVAALSKRKDALLQDAGEELIGSTFVLINDIRYIDRSRGSSVLGEIIGVTAQVAGAVNGIDVKGEKLKKLIASYKGFNVKIKTYLYQLVWDEDISSFFYKDIYTEKIDEAKIRNFENNRGRFSLVYLGMQESSGKTVSFLGINEDTPQQMVRKACQRAMDENVANLQKNFDAFKVKTPLFEVNPLKCEIGLKEGVSEDSRYEVLEATEDSEGRIVYKHTGEIRPASGKIWDNRYMAKEEQAEGAELKYTTFEKVSGGPFYPGMLVREIK